MKARRPIGWIVLSYGLGIALSPFLKLSFSFLWFLTLLFLFLTVAFSKKPVIALIFILCVFTDLGLLHVQNRQSLDQEHIVYVARYYRKKPIEVKGIVISDVQERDFFKGKKTTFTLRVEQIKSPWGWRKKTGKILVNAFRKTNVAYGDFLHVEGKLHRPFNFSEDKNFSYEDYLKTRGIHLLLSIKKDGRIEVLANNQGNSLRALSLMARYKLKRILSLNLTPKEAGIMQAILLGDRSHIPKHVRLLFVQTGTAHILAISGLHVGVVVGLILIMLKVLPLGRRVQFLLAITFLIGYAFLTGGRPSVVRATSMAVVFLASFVVEKETDTLNTLCLAALIILLINPLSLFDIGFQLSFTCVLSIIFLSPKLKSIFIRWRSPEKSKMMRFVYDSISVSLGIWLGVDGLIAYYFGIITPITVLANLIVVPLLSVIVVLGFGLLVAGIFVPFLTFVFAICIKLTLNVMVGSMFLLDKIPYAYFYVKDITIWKIITYYILLLLFWKLPWPRFLKFLYRKCKIIHPGNIASSKIDKA